MDRTRFPVDEWSLIESELRRDDLGAVETLFAVGNGYFGMRGNFDEGRDSHMDGTFVNGFHETWSIRHAEEAYGFARVGQTIVNVPDAKIIRLYVDDEPFVPFEADITEYRRALDLKTGVLTRELVWRTPSGKHVRIRSRRMVSFVERHLGVIDYEVTVLDAHASVLISSQMLNRQDATDEYRAKPLSGDEDFDPRKAESLTERVLIPQLSRERGGRYLLGYRAANSRMTVAAGMDHRFETLDEWEQSAHLDQDHAKQVYRIRATPGTTARLTKTVTYHSSRGVPTRELADRCDRTLDRAAEAGAVQLFADQAAWLADFWERSDVRIGGAPDIQQATRWNLFQLAQASVRTDGGGIAAKGVSGSGYGGHYFWDAEIYALPFFSYTTPDVARNALRFRLGMLPAARERAAELNQRGALFPWRTINGLESSAYYAASTAQYHIDADIAHALMQYVNATGDLDFVARGAIDILVETARMWADLGFWRGNGVRGFHIHGVTGPDEYTTVVNDNLYTNVMAKANLQAAVDMCDRLLRDDPDAYARMALRVDLDTAELAEWRDAAQAMHIPYDEGLGVHPQDAQFLERELWDLDNTPDDKRPLLLHYHPLVIYRFQVLKQADVVLALWLQGHEFTAEEKRRDFEYYDALTTGDSTLSAVVQSIVAAEVGYAHLAIDYFTSAIYVDLANLHRNTADGIHVASTGGVWSALTNGFGGMRDRDGQLDFDPRLPEAWTELAFSIALRGSRLRVTLTREAIAFEIASGEAVTVSVRGSAVVVMPGQPVSVPLAHQGVVIEGTPASADIAGQRRPDGSVITASIPAPLVGEEPE
ncbi:glycoside hydrolase family 65 protein [Homoserinibacter sp. YIM 151385]|uniref:glycoside hydrolase family 65 protein n=1 Tax=Homoserinibacter sp. YIM 151385 TaxID=2985506 RepID=UPI0022F056D4|nr:glycosyl hydrolase family 65 protein [Homoserinibacter sp. YIM 151385]WBU39387.1 glycoside hydrolase family 65 protein [Homoserinibacter sp. YIM 151385]